MPRRYEKPVLMNFQAASGSLGVGALMCNNGPQN